MLWFAFPMMAGIALSWLYGISLPCSLSVLGGALLFMLIGMCRGVPHWLFSVSLVVVMFSLGCVVERLDAARYAPRWSGADGYFEAVLHEAPHVAGRATKVSALVTRLGRDSIRGARRQGVVDLYFENSVDVEALNVGERIFFKSRVEVPRNAGNPAEFDVEHYCYIKDITGTAYLSAESWKSMGMAEPTYSMYALSLREKVLDYYAVLGIGANELPVLSALTLGEKRDLSDAARDIYSAAGVSHILALSGMHLGVLYMILTLLFPLRGYRRWVVLLRELLVIAVLWGYTVMAGCSPSIVRAAVLFTLMSLARCMSRENSSMNTLGFAVVVMLVLYPRWLFDVGFQLSFSAVFAILLLSEPIHRLLRVESHGRIYASIVGFLGVTVSAQLGTLPFVWYYFGTFPLYFLISNIVAVPVVFCIISLSVALLLFSFLPFLQQPLVWALNGLLSAVNHVLGFIASLPGAKFELPYIGLFDTYILAAAIFVLFYGIVVRRKHYIWASVPFAVLLVIISSLRGMSYSEPYIIFFNSKGCPAAQLVVSREKSYIMSSYPEWDIDLLPVAKAFWKREKMAVPMLLPDSYSDNHVELSGGMLYFAGRRIKMLADDCWKSDKTIQPVDCVFLCRGFLGSIKSLLEVYPTRYIVMDATLYKNSRRRILRECKEAGVRCIDLSSMGAVKLSCRKTGVHFTLMRGK